METTIAIRESTAQILAGLKRKMNLKSMDEVIVEIVRKSENLPQTRFGSQPNLKEFKEKDRAYTHDL